MSDSETVTDCTQSSKSSLLNDEQSVTKNDSSSTEYQIEKTSEAGECANTKVKEATSLSSENEVYETKSYETNKYRNQKEPDWSDDEDEDSSSSCSSTDSDTFFNTLHENSVPKNIGPVKTKGELGLDELPPIEDLHIPVSIEELEKVGTVYTIVEKQVVIHAMKEMQPLDLDSVLFLSSEEPLGKVFDVFGPVSQPFYCVRFNSDEHIEQKGIKLGADVFFVPRNQDITMYVFMDELQNQKGSDASWKDNNEPPEQFLDYSDDEQERAAKKKRKPRNRSRFINRDKMDVNTKRPALAAGSSERVFAVPASPDRRRYQSPSKFCHEYMSPSSPSISVPSSAGTPHSFRSSPVNSYLPHVSNYSHPLPPPSPSLCPVSPVFGQMPVMRPVSPSLNPSFRPPLSFKSIPTLPPEPYQNLFNQRFSSPPCTPTPISPWLPCQNFSSPSYTPSTPSISPWLPGRGPDAAVNNPIGSPLSVQIPSNFSSPPPFVCYEPPSRPPGHFPEAYENSVRCWFKHPFSH